MNMRFTFLHMHYACISKDTETVSGGCDAKCTQNMQQRMKLRPDAIITATTKKIGDFRMKVFGEKHWQTDKCEWKKCNNVLNDTAYHMRDWVYEWVNIMNENSWNECFTIFSVWNVCLVIITMCVVCMQRIALHMLLEVNIFN